MAAVPAAEGGDHTPEHKQRLVDVHRLLMRGGGWGEQAEAGIV